MAESLEKLSWTEIRDLFRDWREDNVRRSSCVIELWESKLENKQHKLGDERYLVLEQVCVAAADVNRLDVMDHCLQGLNEVFPDSLRVKRLQALKLEVMEKYDEALEHLSQIIKRDETNAAPRKRKIAIYKSRGQIGEAVRELSDYLKKFMSDQEAWQELSELYLSEQEYGKAAFCMEDVILNSPHNHLYHQRYADIKYTQGGIENMEIAKAHYCLALKLCASNMRALYGLFLTASNIAVNQKTPSQKKKEASKLAVWASKQIKEQYNDSSVDGNNVAALNTLLSNLQITSA